MTAHTERLTQNHRYQFVHGNDADFVAYQLRLGDGTWRTFAEWMIPPLAAVTRSDA